MTSSDVVAQAIFSSYFLLIFGLFALIWHSQRANIRKVYSLKDADILTFTFLTLASFSHTWFCESLSRSQISIDFRLDPRLLLDMFKFMAVSVVLMIILHARYIYHHLSGASRHMNQQLFSQENLQTRICYPESSPGWSTQTSSNRRGPQFVEAL